MSSSLYSAIHKAADLKVPGRSMTLPGTIIENFLSRECGQRLERFLMSVSGGGFVNSAVNVLQMMMETIEFWLNFRKSRPTMEFPLMFKFPAVHFLLENL